MEKVKENVLVIGCGPHFRTRYFPVVADAIKRGYFNELAVLDLEQQRSTIEAFFQMQECKPSHCIFLDGAEAELKSQGASAVRAILSKGHFRHAILSTEPLSHMQYLTQLLDCGVNVFVDKPITATDLRSSKPSFLTDIDDLIARGNRAAVRTVVSCERRMNPGYQHAFELLGGFMREARHPITRINMYFGDGKLPLPAEYIGNNHPYRFGYGLLLHSGYHYLDVVAQLVRMNEETFSNSYTLKNVLASFQSVMDNIVNVRRVVPKGATSCANSYAELQRVSPTGEVDVSAIADYECPEYGLLAVNIALTNSSVTARTKFDRITDLYENVRVRQEQLVVNVGALATLRISSFPFKKLAPEANAIEHFDIDFMYRPNIHLPAKVVRLDRRRISETVADIPTGIAMNVVGRQRQLQSFLSGGDGNSLLASHRRTAELLDRLYVARQRRSEFAAI